MKDLLLRLTTLTILATFVASQDVETGVQTSDVELLFDSDSIVINPEKRLELQCGVKGTYRNCYWEREDGQIFQVVDVHDNLVSGMSGPERLTGNQCGIVLNSVSIEDHGNWMCKVFIIGDALMDTKEIIVTITPSKPQLEISNRPLVVDTSSKQTITCSVAKARPKATITWYLADEDITQNSQSTFIPTDKKKGIYKTESVLTRQFEPRDNKKRLICSVEHQTLSEPLVDFVDVDVRFAPVDQETLVFYEVQLGKEFDISVNYSSNPSPKYLTWSFGDSFDNMLTSIQVPGVGTEGRYTARDSMLLPNGDFSSILHINEVLEIDFQRKFKLTVENDLGRADYQIMLSMDKAPRDGGSASDHSIMLQHESDYPGPNAEYSSKYLSDGAVAGIVIVVLLVIFIILVAGYARHNQMYCFAVKEESEKDGGKENKEEHSDTESARAPSTTTNKGQMFMKSINKNISNIKNRISKQKKSGDTQMQQMEEGVAGDKEEKDKEGEGEEKSPKKDAPQTDEVVYAKLDLEKKDTTTIEKEGSEKTEYAKIIGTVKDNKVEEKKE